jgi:hypothetical protein
MAAPQGALVSIEDPGPETSRTLVGSGVTVVREMDGYLLALAGAGDLAIMEEMGLDFVILDPSIKGKTYFTVAMPNAKAFRELAAGIEVLRYDRKEAVIEASQEEALRFAEGGGEIARLFLRPIRPRPRRRMTLLGESMQADSLIQSIVDSVSGAEIDAGVQRLQDFVTRYATHDSCQAAADWIKAEFESFGIDSVFFHNYSTVYKDNVVAVIPGRGDPGKIVIVGGHYDSITSDHDNCPGADDNATGTVCAVECARVLSDYEFNYTLTFIAFGGEELGLYGSEGYAADAAARGDDIVGVVVADMLGYVAGGDALDIDIIDNASSEWMRTLAGDLAGLYIPGLPVVDGSLPGGASSDHASFWAHGYDAILFFEDSGDYSPYIHTTDDVVGLSYNSPTLAERSIKLATALLATIAEPFTIAVRHNPLENTEDTANPYRVVAEVVSAGTLNPDSLLVRYSTGGGFNTLTMTSTGGPDEYEAYIPAQPGGTWVDYYLVPCLV